MNTPSDSWRDLYAQKQDANRGAQNSERYSQFVRGARLVLPLFAIIMIVVLIIWSGNDAIETRDIPMDITQPVISAKIGKNELLTPSFSSRDKEGRPFTITADRAFQGSGNENLVILDNPMADMALDGGHYLVGRAQKGGYRQDTQRLFLNEDVQIVHDEGLHLLTEELHINMDQDLMWSDVDVQIQGKQGTLQAAGMNGNAALSVLTFKGPAILTLNTLDSSLGGLSGSGS